MAETNPTPQVADTWFLVANRDRLSIKISGSVTVGESAAGLLKLESTRPEERWLTLTIDPGGFLVITHLAEFCHLESPGHWSLDNAGALLPEGTEVRLPGNELYISQQIQQGKAQQTVIVSRKDRSPEIVVSASNDDAVAEKAFETSDTVVLPAIEEVILELPETNLPQHPKEPQTQLAEGVAERPRYQMPAPPLRNRNERTRLRALMRRRRGWRVAAVAGLLLLGSGWWMLSDSRVEPPGLFVLGERLWGADSGPDSASVPVDTDTTTPSSAADERDVSPRGVSDEVILTGEEDTRVEIFTPTHLDDGQVTQTLDEPYVDDNATLDEPYVDDNATADAAVGVPDYGFTESGAATTNPVENTDAPFLVAQKLASARELLAQGYVVWPEENATRLLGELLAENPQNREALVLLEEAAGQMLQNARAAYADGFEDSAISELRQVLSFHPNYSPAREQYLEWLMER